MTKKFLGINLKRKSFFFRFVRFVVSVVVISALLLGITLLVGEVSNLDQSKISGITGSAQDALQGKNININEKSLTSFVDGLISNIKMPDLSFKTLFGKLVRNVATKVVSTETAKKNELFDTCILADIHEDFANLSKALIKAKSLSCSKIFVIGDLTNYGDVTTLKDVKMALDGSGLQYYVIPGDHDLAQSVNSDNFKKVFGDTYRMVDLSGVEFMMLDNSPNYTIMDPKQVLWFETNISTADYVILSQPLYVEGLNPPFNTIYMGSTRNPPTDAALIKKQEAVKDQGKQILDLIEKNTNVKAVFAGEHHRSSELTDPVRSSLKHIVIGAVSSTVDTYPQSVIQTSRFSLLRIYEEKSYSIEDIVLD